MDLEAQCRLAIDGGMSLEITLKQVEVCIQCLGV